MNNIIEKFDTKALSQQVNWLNEFLAKFLESNCEIRKFFNTYFSNCQARDYHDYIKKFNLDRWFGSDMNQTIEIVQINDELKFATTRYGMLAPLSQFDCNKAPIKNVIMDFFLNPNKFIERSRQN